MLTEFLDPKAVSFKEVRREDVQAFVEKHYLGKYPTGAKLYLGIFYNNVMVGMIIYGSPIGPQVVNAIFKPESKVTHQDILELKRLFLVDDENILPKDAKKNLAGYSISKGNDFVEQKFPDTKIIVTYSDSEVHTGAVYKATNAIYQGEYNGKKRWVYPVGDRRQKQWILKNLKSNIDWKKDINEDQEKRQTDFSELPENRPYGFVIFSDGSFSVVEDWGGHDEIAKNNGYSTLDKLFSNGGLRIAWNAYGEYYHAVGLDEKMSIRAKKTIKDISEFYGVDLRFYSSVSFKEIREAINESLDILRQMWNDRSIL